MDIAKNMRGKGHAQICYPVFMDFLEDMYNIDTFYLRVLKSNERAQHIYGKVGFVVIEETEKDLKMELRI
jgi:RimJ/RimL family protein N-acetyltransferase